MDTPRSQRPRTTRKTAKSGDRADGTEALPQDASASSKSDGRVFDDIDLAAYVEELLSVKVEAIGTNLERTLSDRLIDLVETNQRLADNVEAVRRLLGEGGAAQAVASGGQPRLEQKAAAAEERSATLQEEIYRLRDERAALKSAVESLTDRERQTCEREQAVRSEARQGQLDLVGARADLAAATRQLQEARQREEAARTEATRLKEELAVLRAERSAQRQTEESLPSLRDELQGLRATEGRLHDENASLKAEVSRMRGHEHSLKVQAEEIQRLENVIAALQQDLAEARRAPATATPSSADSTQALERERARHESESAALQQRCTAAEMARDEAQKATEELRLAHQGLESQLCEAAALASQLESLRAERDHYDAATRDATANLESVREDALTRVAAAEAGQRAAEERMQQLERELRAEVEALTSKKNALTETLRTYSDPDKFRDIKLREMHQSIETLRATMREKDNLLGESGQEQLMLGQELEKVRKEKYESQVLYERRIKELQESLQREVREKEKERDERHLLEEQMAKTRKKWPLW